MNIVEKPQEEETPPEAVETDPPAGEPVDDEGTGDEGDGDDDGGEPAAVEEPAEEAEAEPDEHETLRTERDAVAQQNRALREEVAFHRGRAAGQAPPKREAADEDEEEPDITDEEILKTLDKDPAGTIRRVAEKIAAKEVNRLRKEASQRSEVDSRVQEVRDDDRTKTFDRYPQLQQGHPEYNQEFFQATDKILRAMFVRNGKRYLQGDIMTAAAAAYGELVDEGVIEPKRRRKPQVDEGRPANGNGTRDVVRRAVVDSGLRRSTAAPQSSKTKDPFVGLNFTDADKRRVEKRCREFGIGTDVWRKNYDATAGDQDNV